MVGNKTYLSKASKLFYLFLNSSVHRISSKQIIRQDFYKYCISSPFVQILSHPNFVVNIFLIRRYI